MLPSDPPEAGSSGASEACFPRRRLAVWLICESERVVREGKCIDKLKERKKQKRIEAKNEGARQRGSPACTNSFKLVSSVCDSRHSNLLFFFRVAVLMHPTSYLMLIRHSLFCRCRRFAARSGAGQEAPSDEVRGARELAHQMDPPRFIPRPGVFCVSSHLAALPRPVAHICAPPAADPQQELIIQHRPTLNHGLGGLATARVGPARQVADKTFYMSDLRQRLQDITLEMQAMDDEMEQIEHDGALHTQLQRKHENLLREVRLKEGNLADFNLALDKVRQHIAVADVRAMYDRLRDRNEHERSRVDDEFLRATAAETAVQEIEERIGEHYEKIAEVSRSLRESNRGVWCDCFCRAFPPLHHISLRFCLSLPSLAAHAGSRGGREAGVPGAAGDECGAEQGGRAQRPDTRRGRGEDPDG